MYVLVSPNLFSFNTSSKQQKFYIEPMMFLSMNVAENTRKIFSYCVLRECVGDYNVDCCFSSILLRPLRKIVYTCVYSNMIKPNGVKYIKTEQFLKHGQKYSRTVVSRHKRGKKQTRVVELRPLFRPRPGGSSQNTNTVRERCLCESRTE